jgi:peptidyl-prolyl cis-trans isomerase C
MSPRYLSFVAVIPALGALLGAVGCQRNDAKKKSPDQERKEAIDKRREAHDDSVRVAGQARGDLGAPLAKVGDVVITVGEFQDQLGRQSPHIRNRFTSLEQKREFLDSLIRFEVLAAEAARRGLDQDAEVVRTMKSVMVQKLMREEFETRVPPESIPEADLKASYEANLAEYVRPQEVRASAIVVKNAAQAKKIATEAQGEAGKTNKGFRELVQKYSTDDPTKVRGGDLRYFARDTKDLPKPVIDAAFSLGQTGTVSGAIDAGDGTWWILKQTGHKKAMTKTYDDVKQSIRSKLHRERRLAAQEQFVTDLRAAAKIEVNETNLAKVKIDTSRKQEAADPHDHGAPPLPEQP